MAAEAEFFRSEINIHQSSFVIPATDRTTVLPVAVQEEVAERKERLRELLRRDREAGLPGVALPNAFGRKDRHAGEKWPWQWLFPGANPSRDPETGMVRRHHVHPDSYSAALREAVDQTMIDKRVTSHALRHAYSYCYIC